MSETNLEYPWKHVGDVPDKTLEAWALPICVAEMRTMDEKQFRQRMYIQKLGASELRIRRDSNGMIRTQRSLTPTE